MNYKVYVFKTVKGLNILNLPLYSFYLSTAELYDPCIPQDFEQHGKFTVEFAKLTTVVAPDVPADSIGDAVRDTAGVQLITIFDDILKHNPGKSIAIGLNDRAQVECLKNHYGDSMFTLGSAYNDNESYNLVLENFTQSHLYRQKIGLLPITDHDRTIHSNYKDKSLVPVYKQIFNDLNLVPRAIEQVGDYIIPIRDFFNQDNFFQHIENAGLPLTDPAKIYYTKWKSTIDNWSNL